MNPPRLKLPVTTPTNFPFSSPIGEEIATPAYHPDDHDSSSDAFSNPFDSPNPNFRDSESNTTVSNNTSKRRYHNGPARRPTRTEAGSRSDRVLQAIGQPKRVRPGLNVITDFHKAKSENNVLQAQQSSAMQQDSRQVAQRAGTFVNLNDLKALSKTREKQRLRSLKKKRQAKENREVEVAEPEKQNAYLSADLVSRIAGVGLGLVHDSPNGQRSGNRTELSPSDGPIVIGMSVPATEAISRVYENQYSATSQTPMTPAIVITPADESFKTDHRHLDVAPRRPASSIYSTATPWMSTYIDGRDAPPVPAIPASHAKAHEPTNGVTPITNNGSQSADANAHPKDDLQLVLRPRSLSNGTLVPRHNRNSVDTIGTRPRSKGWWNVMLSPLSPFLSRSNTLASWRTVETPKTPPVPALPSDMAHLVRSQTLNEKIEIPKTPQTCATATSVSSCWTDWSDWERTLEEKRANEDLAYSREVLPIASDQPADSVASPEDETTKDISISPNTSGLAAEYFLACAHDAISPKPYFECIGHDCEKKLPLLVRDPDMVITHEYDEEELSRGLGETERDLATSPYHNTNPNNPFFQDDANSSTKSMHEAESIRSRAASVSTIFEDDAAFSPQAREADTATVVRAHSVTPEPARESHSTEDATGLNPFEHHREAASPAQWGDLAFSAPGGSNTNTHGDTNIHIPPQAAPLSDNPRVESARDIEAPREFTRTPPFNLESTRGSHAISDHPDSDDDIQAGVPPPYSPPRRAPRFPPPVAVPGPHEQPQSPGPFSPEAQRVLAERGAVSLHEMGQRNPEDASYYPEELPPRPAEGGYGFAGLRMQDAETRRQRHEKEDAFYRKCGGLWRGRGCIGDNGCFGRGGAEGRKRKRLHLIIFTGLLVMIITVIVLAIKLTRKGDATPVESQWLNLTGFPPMPTGIATIAQPDNNVADTGCVSPSSMWSCALPKEEQADIAPNSPNQPNFRLEIRFRNGTFDNSTAIASNSSTKRSSLASGMNASQFFRRKILDTRDLFTSELYTSSPSPPSEDDQIFLGNTTDDISEPFNGEATPFYITMLSTATQSASRLTKRASNSSDGFPDLSSSIPSPAVDSDGTAAAATLLPLPSSQPVRLYNRGLSTEHYGFYTYFDKSIFLESTAPLNSTSTSTLPADSDGGSTKSEAKVRCTWAQTRFLVQIWTKGLGTGEMALLPDSNTSSTASTSSSTNSSATDFSRPGSFPYPVTVKLDRHGGAEKKKMVYCYGLDEDAKPIDDEAKLQLEFRGFGGTLINPASGIFNISGSSGEDGYGGIDGGTGGCKCSWQNWVAQF